jgi:telomerase reverse transcriptase
MRSLFGAGTLGLTEVLPAYCRFLETLRTKFSDGIPQLYFTSADIEHCYDNINQEHLYKQVRSVLAEDQYITQNHFILHPKERNGSTRCRWKKQTCSPANFLDITSASTGYRDKFYNSIFIDGVNFSVDKKQTILGLLKDHIFGQLIIGSGKNGQRMMLQRKGIPQGSILSSLFCNAYFGNVEDKIFDGVFEKDSLVIRGSNAANNTLGIENPSALHFLVRIVDDFLLISTDYDTSQRFLNRLQRGKVARKSPSEIAFC